jgi:hypothetical protein
MFFNDGKPVCPYDRPVPPPHVPCYHDSYGHDCYHEHKGFPHPALPTNGPFLGSAFTLQNYNPFLFDSYNVRYGQIINFSENIETRFTQRPDASCINLAAKINMVEAINKNVVLEDYLEKCLSQGYETYRQGIPMIKSKLTFRMYYTIFDDMGGAVDERMMDVSTYEQLLHYTDIRDFFVQSAKGIFVDNIPAYDYGGLYRLAINKMELWVDVIDTAQHVEQGYNPYYQFTDNNQRITMQHDTIEACVPDDTMKLATIDIMYSIPFQANITTRLRVSFTAFMSDMIVVNQTYGIWNALYEPTEEKMKHLEDEIATLKETDTLMQAQIDALQTSLNALMEIVSGHTAAIEQNTVDITNLRNVFNDNITSINSRLTSLEGRVSALEAIPIAIHKYRDGDEYIKSQLTWENIGELYQVNTNFTASGNLQDEVDAGYIKPLTLVE